MEGSSVPYILTNKGAKNCITVFTIETVVKCSFHNSFYFQQKKATIFCVHPLLFIFMYFVICVEKKKDFYFFEFIKNLNISPLIILIHTPFYVIYPF